MKVAIIVLVIIGILDALLVIMCAKMERKGANEVSRYIDADKMLEVCTKYIASVFPKGYEFAKQDAELLIATEPSIDIVFCKDCRDCVEKGVGADCPSGYGYLYCTRKKSVVCEDDYCSWGSRK